MQVQSAIPVWKKARAGLGRLYRDKVRRHLPVLAFHRIRPHDGTSLDTFKRILDQVASDYRTVTLGEVGRLLRSGTRLPRNHIALTFDDATLDQYTKAAPALDERGLCATFAVIGCTLFDRVVPPLHGYLHILETTTKPSARFSFPPLVPAQTLTLDDVGKRALADRRSPLRRAVQASPHALGTEIVAAFGEALDVPSPVVGDLFMSLDQVRSLRDRGHEPAGHTLWHQDVHEPDVETWTRHLCEGFSLMNDAFGSRDHPFIYPFGKERRSAIHRAVQAAGFCCAATTEAGTNTRSTDTHAIRRVSIDSDTPVPLATIY